MALVTAEVFCARSEDSRAIASARGTFRFPNATAARIVHLAVGRQNWITGFDQLRAPITTLAQRHKCCVQSSGGVQQSLELELSVGAIDYFCVTACLWAVGKHCLPQETQQNYLPYSVRAHSLRHGECHGKPLCQTNSCIYHPESNKRFTIQYLDFLSENFVKIASIERSTIYHFGVLSVYWKYRHTYVATTSIR